MRWTGECVNEILAYMFCMLVCGWSQSACADAVWTRVVTCTHIGSGYLNMA